jgi:hypothetical protein
LLRFPACPAPLPSSRVIRRLGEKSDRGDLIEKLRPGFSIGLASPRFQFIDFGVPLLELAGEILQMGFFVFHDSLLFD